MTLKANELRIGNYLNIQEQSIHWNGYNFKDTIFEIEVIYPKKVYFKGYVLYEEYGSLKPIPLTDEWLINLGAFEFDNQFIFDRFRIKYRPDYKFYYVLCKETNAYITKVEYVHEWQNVVFALNNQELILKNK